MRPATYRHAAGTASASSTVAIFLSSAVMYFAVAVWLDRHGAFLHIDALFNADAPWYLRGLIEGRGTGTSWGPRSFVHPNIANLLHPLVAVVGGVFDSIGINPDLARRLAALAIAPLAAATEATLFYRVVKPFTPAAAPLSAWYAVTFATVLFAAVPESFGLTGLGLALLFSVLEQERRSRRRSTIGLVAVAALLIGVTVTNIVLVVVCVAVHRGVRDGQYLALKHAFAPVIYALLVTAVLAGASAGIQGSLADYVPRFEQLHEAPLLRDVASGHTRTVTAVTAQIRKYWRRATIDFPEAVSYAIAPPRPRVVLGTADSRNDAPIGFTYQDTRTAWWRIVVTTSAMVLGCAAAWRRRDESRSLYLTAAALLVYHWLFHTFFGEELLLYSKHWSIGAALLFAAFLPRNSSSASALLASGAFLLTALNTGRVLLDIVRTLTAP